MVDFFGVGYLTGTEEMSNQRLKCYWIEKERFLSEVQANSYPLPYISRTYLVWEFLTSDLSLRRVQCAIIFYAPILSFRHLVIPFPNQSIRHPNFSLIDYNYTPK